MAVSLIENLSVDFDPQKYHDEYRQALRELIDAKIVGKEVVNAPSPGDRGKVVDLMEALQASVKLAEENRQKSGAEGASGKKKGRKAKTGS
jgi:DNA end-binding protein Ku